MSEPFADELSPILALPLLQAAQEQKHIPHNEALCRLEILVQAVVQSRSLSLPPDSPAEGARFLIPAGAAGDWAGRDGQIAAFLQGGWLYLSAQEGWQIWLADEALLLRHIGGAWLSAAAQEAEVARLGINTTAAGANRLALAGEASLFTHEGAGHQIKVNKAAAGETASLLFQTAWGGRAELGTSGSDDFALKVSVDGSAWITALSVARATGQLSGAALTQSANDPVPGRLLKAGDYGWPAALSLTSGDDLDLITGSGVRICAAAALTAGNHYPENAAGALLMIDRPDAGAAQLYIPEGSPQLWLRSKNAAGVWQPWARLGATRGSGANGDWLRLPDGTQICQHHFSTSLAAASSWSYPQSFTSPPQISGLAESASLAVLCLEGPPGLSAASLSLRGADELRRAAPVHLTAIGRWF